jgi:hypothetical protein
MLVVTDARTKISPRTVTGRDGRKVDAAQWQTGHLHETHATHAHTRAIRLNPPQAQPHDTLCRHNARWPYTIPNNNMHMLYGCMVQKRQSLLGV